jgi:hypothetical protein
MQSGSVQIRLGDKAQICSAQVRPEDRVHICGAQLGQEGRVQCVGAPKEEEDGGSPSGGGDKLTIVDGLVWTASR